MENKQRLIDVRKKLKKAKPVFVRKDSFKISRLGKNRKKKLKWRRPRGRHNKVREKKKGNMKQPSIGYRSPKKIRGLLNGFKMIYISNMKELLNLKKEEMGIIRNIGAKKKVELMKKAKELKINLYKIDADKEITKIEEKSMELKKRREERIKKKLEREKKEKKKEESKTDKEKKEEIDLQKEKTLHQKIEEKQTMHHDSLEKSHSHEIKQEHKNVRDEGRGLENNQ